VSAVVDAITQLSVGLAARARMHPVNRRRYQFVVTVSADEDQEGYDDPEWVADAAVGVLANIYGYECFFDEIVELPSEVAEA